MVWLSIAAYAAEPPGATQPGELVHPIEPVDNCVDCHQGWEDSPVDAWSGTMMANAVEDPLFLAALTIANQDIPLIGDFCLRCHTVPGWLEGRCAPGDTSLLVPTDYEGINCDSCHRMTMAPNGPLTANATYTVVDDLAKRGTFDTTVAPHDTVVDPYLDSSYFCGLCHEVSNPLFGDFPIERTFSEWEASAFAQEGGQSCQDCHMLPEQGYAANSYDAPIRTVNVHRFVGGNTWVPQVLAGEHPERDPASYLAVVEGARDLLQDSAIVTIEAPPTLYRGHLGKLLVKVENTTGHKLPSGYPEGRRIWLEVHVTDATGRELLSSGVYDPETAEIVDAPNDPWLRKYEARLGSDDVFSYHMVQQDELLFDGRIPPKGFLPRSDIAPIGREYPLLPDGTMVNWDEAPYELVIPADAVGPLTVTADLWYQTTIREFVEFLRDADQTDTYGKDAYDLWVKYGKSPPEPMESTSVTVNLLDPVVSGGDDEPEGCACAPGGPPAAWTVVAGLAALGYCGRRVIAPA
jgi:hypothetical protein